jgi:hypothetical protein
MQSQLIVCDLSRCDDRPVPAELLPHALRRAGRAYASTFPREARLDLPFRAADVVGVAFPV